MVSDINLNLKNLFLDWTDVVRHKFIDWDLETQPLQIKTDSVAGSEDYMTLIFYTQDNNDIYDFRSLGYISVKFTAPLAYAVRSCTSGYNQFPISPPTEPSKIWTISKSFADLTIDCNGVRLLEINFASDSRSECENKWSQDVAKFSFWGTTNEDTASDGYRIIPKTINGGWSDFGDWSECSAACEGGTQTRTRTCTEPAPENGGTDCVGDSTETRECNIQDCPGNSPFKTEIENFSNIFRIFIIFSVLPKYLREYLGNITESKT